MTLEAEMGALRQAVTDLTAGIAELRQSTDILSAGREEAMAEFKKQIEGGAAAAPKPTRSRKSKDEAVPAADAGVQEPVQEQIPAAEAAAATRRSVDTSDEGLKALVTPWMGKQDTPEKRGAAAGQIQAMLQHFGTPMLTGETSTLDGGQRYQAYFFLERIIAGKPVNYSQDYDFDADPLAQDGAPAAAYGGDFGIG